MDSERFAAGIVTPTRHTWSDQNFVFANFVVLPQMITAGR